MKKTCLGIVILTVLLCACGCGKETLEIHQARPTPDYEYQLYCSDDVILGEVLEEREGYYSNPDGSIKEIENAWITPYIIKVEKSYKGLIEEGKTIVVNTWNRSGIYPGDEEKYNIVSDEKEFYLHKGQRGVFMIAASEYLVADDGEKAYYVVYEDEGVFEPKAGGDAVMNAGAKAVYASPSFEITLDQIQDDIRKADELYHSSDKKAVDDAA